MADPQFVGAALGAATSASSITLDLTALTGGIGAAPIEGDVVLVLPVRASGTGVPGVITSGYTLLMPLLSEYTRSVFSSLNIKRMGAVPDTSVECEASGAAAYGSVVIAYVLRGVGLSWSLNTASAKTSAVPNSPAVTTTVADSLVISIGAGTTDTTPVNFTVPAGYSNAVITNSAGTSYGCHVEIASKAIAAPAAENPAAWGGGETNSSDAWLAYTLVLTPSGVAVLGHASVVALYRQANPVYVEQASVAVLYAQANPAYMEHASVVVLYAPPAAPSVYPQACLINT